MNKDISQFLGPISEDNPSGPNIRYSEAYREIQRIKTDEMPYKGGDYKQLEKLCEQALEHRSKDLHIAAILAEVWSHLYGLRGLSDGLDLITKLCENFWPSLHPSTSGELDARVSTFVWINSKLADVVLSVQMTQPSMPGEVSHTLADLIDARQLEMVLQKAGFRKNDIFETAKQEGRPILSEVARSTLMTPTLFYERLLESVQRCFMVVRKLEELLEKELEDEAVLFRNFDEHLSQIEKFAEESLEQKRSIPVTREPIQSEENYVEKADSIPRLEAMSVEELYETLEKVANRFEEVDPRSPAPKLVRKAVKWGRMSATELLSELGEHNLSIGEVNKILS